MAVYDFERKPVKTRKKHWCLYCGEVIPAGADGAERESGFDEDGPFRRYACARCAHISMSFGGGVITAAKT